MTGSNPTGSRYCIIHGHFYQPPRENPWLGIVQRQSSAAPYHDWNERISEECYRPNAFSRLLDSAGMIKGIHNNYRTISFNFGPTLWLWLEQQYPSVCAHIVEADQESALRLNGHGNALAQVYNHIIMPLASRRDQLTQIRWAKQFFADRFSREPEGIWLAETAINTITAQCLVDEGIRFVVLSPTQAKQFRPLDSSVPWTPNENNALPTTRPYRLFPHGKDHNRYLDVFFFDEALSRATSFENVLTDASVLASRILEKYTADAAESQSVIIATDGETFGHHKPFGDMCLAYFFAELAAKSEIEPVNFGYVLEKCSPQWEVELHNASGEGTAWSCAHGTGRWIRDCGCSTGGRPDWNQKWRTPLRLSLDKCQVSLDKQYVRYMESIGVYPWKARDQYVPHGESCTTEAAFADFLKQARKKNIATSPTVKQLQEARRLLEAQKYMLFAYTSCGWFFNDISGIETVQNLVYAGRALQLMGPGDERDTALEHLRSGLSQAESNIPGITGCSLLETYVLPWWHDLELLAFSAALDFAHTGKKKRERTSAAHLKITVEDSISRTLRQTIYLLCRVQVARNLTGESGHYDILVVRTHTGALSGYLRAIAPEDLGRPLVFNRRRFLRDPEVKRLLVSDLFDESRATLSQALQARLTPTMVRAVATVHKVHGGDIETLAALGHSLNTFVEAPMRAALTMRFNRTMAGLKSAHAPLDQIFGRLLTVYEQSRRLNIAIDFGFTRELLERLLARQLDTFSSTLAIGQCDRMRYLLNIVDRFKIPIRKNHLEDRFHSILQGPIKELHKRTLAGTTSGETREILIRIIGFARRMNFNTDAFVLP